MRRHLWVALLASAALAACSSGSSAGTVPGTSGAAAGTASATPSGTASASVPASATPSSPSASASVTTVAATPSPSATAATKPVVVLEPDGLGILVGASSVRQLPFGTDLATLRTAASAALGPVSTTNQSECGQGPRVQLARDGFSMLFDGTRFVGWFDAGRTAPRLTTADGLGVGSTLAQVRQSLGTVQVTTDTLGPEWTTDGISGLLDGTKAASKVTGIYAGESCFFR